MQLANSIWVITGSGRGLGRSMALALAKHGAHIAVVDMDPKGIDETCQLCQQIGVKATGWQADISDESAVEQLIKDIDHHFGSIDAWVNNAGITRDGLLIKAKDGQIISKMSLADWQKVLDVNLTGVFLGTREVASYWAEKKHPGLVVSISSISRHGNIGQSNYVAAKAAIASLTVTWAKELIRYGIRVTAIAPGYMETEMTKSIKPEAMEKIRSQIPLNRLGQPEEIAHTLIYIAENDYVHGRVIECDGGLRI